MNYDSILDTHFRGHKKVRLKAIAERLRTGAIIPKGTFVIMASGDRKIHFSILKKDTPHKGFSTPFVLNSKAELLGVTPRYLFWFFSHEAVGSFLLENAKGAVFVRVPQSILWELQIPIPKSGFKADVPDELVLTRPKGRFDEHLAAFYDDYIFNVKNDRFHTALILAGAMAEMLVYQALLDSGVDAKLLDDDRNLGLGKMITYLRLLKLDREVSLNHLEDLQKRRNAAIHAGLLSRRPPGFSKDDLKCFDHIVKCFGL